MPIIADTLKTKYFLFFLISILSISLLSRCGGDSALAQAGVVESQGVTGTNSGPETIDDSFVNMGNIPLTGLAQTGNVSVADLVDRYAFSAQANTDFQIVFEEVSKAGEANLTLIYVDGSEQGKVLLEVTDNLETDSPAIINFRAPLEAAYYIDVDGVYSLSVTENIGGPMTSYPQISSLNLSNIFLYGDAIDLSVTMISAVTDNVTVALTSGGEEASLSDLSLSTNDVSGMSFTTSFPTWGDVRETDGSVWDLSLELRNIETSNVFTTRYDGSWDFLSTLVETQYGDPSQLGGNVYFIQNSGFIPKQLTLSAATNSDVTCDPPKLSSAPSLDGDSFLNETMLANYSIPIDRASTVNVYIRGDGEGFSFDADDISGSATTSGAEAALFILSESTIGNYYIDIELVDAGDVNCKSFYRSQDPLDDTNFSNTYLLHQLDGTNLENRIMTTSFSRTEFNVFGGI